MQNVVASAFPFHVPVLFLAQVEVEGGAKVYNFVRVSNTTRGCPKSCF